MCCGKISMRSLYTRTWCWQAGRPATVVTSAVGQPQPLPAVEPRGVAGATAALCVGQIPVGLERQLLYLKFLKSQQGNQANHLKAFKKIICTAYNNTLPVIDYKNKSSLNCVIT